MSSGGAAGWGGGLALLLRVHDLDFQRMQITVRHGKGGKNRRTMLSSRIAEKLQCHLEEVGREGRQDLAAEDRWPWAAPLTFPNTANTYRRIRLSNSEWFRLMVIACQRKRSHGRPPLVSNF